MQDEDIFATGADIKPPAKAWGLDSALGRYWLPDPADPAAWVPGALGARHWPRGYMRTSNLISAYVDQRALMIHEEHRIFEGLQERPDLYAQLAVLQRDPETGKLPYKAAREIAETALVAAKANAASVLGTAYHTALEVRVKTGRLIGTEEIRDGILALERMMRDRLLVPVPSLAERIVVNTKVQCAGQFDLPLQDYSRDDVPLLMADLKTKKKDFWGVLEQRAQLAVYAHADAMWDERLQCYVEVPPFDLKRGVLLHVPQGRAETAMEVQLLNLDLEAGWKTALRCREVINDRAAAKSVPYLRSLPIESLPLNTAGRIRQRLAMVQTLAEGSEVLAQINGLGVMPIDALELSELVSEAIQRISANQLTTELVTG